MFRKLLTLDEAQETIKRNFEAKPLGVENVPLLEGHDRVLAEDVMASFDVPPFDRSTVDGFAVRAKDTFGTEENKPITLTISGTVSAGELPRKAVKPSKAVEIVTGAPIPEGADAVVMVEDTERNGDALKVYSAVTNGENVMKAGSDIGKGETVLKTGQLLGSREIGVLAALGMQQVKVYAVPRVAVISTGAEVAELGKDLPLGKIFDINAYSLSGAVLESGGKPIRLGVFPDDLNELQNVLREALASADVVVASGGVSVGPKDFMPAALDSLGKPGVIVCGVAIKPGKPVTVALVNGKLVFSLPGHPASALLTFHLFVHPVIQLMTGRTVSKPLEVKAFAGMRMFSAKGRRTFVMVSLRHEGERFVAVPVSSGLSGAITTLAKADGFVEVAENQQFVDAGEEVIVRLLEDLPSR
jgi:putative molybdopterin biosynthesis protein